MIVIGRTARDLGARFALALLLAMPPTAFAALSCSTIPTNGTAGLPITSGSGSGQWQVDPATVINNGTTTPTVAPGGNTAVDAGGAGTPLPTLPPFLPTSFPAVGTVDLSSAGPIAAGSYRTVTATASPTVFSGGSYYIDTLTANGGVRLAPGDYFVKNTFTLGDNLTISPAGVVRIFIGPTGKLDVTKNSTSMNSGGSVENLQVYVYNGGQFLATKNDFSFTGLIYAPGSSTQIRIDGPDALISGAVLGGGAVELGKSGAGNFATVTYTPAIQAALAQISTCGLVADYHFDECTYTGLAGEIKSSSGGVNATSGGAIASTSPGGIVGRYFNTNAQNKYATTQSPVGIPGDYTLSLWMKLPFAAPGSDPIFATGSLASSGGCKGDLFNIRSDNGYKWRVYRASTGGTNGVYALSALASGWHHFAVVASGSTSRLYVDGVDRGTIALRANADATNLGLGFVGTSCDDPSHQAIRAPLDEYMLFRSALSASDVSDLYNNQLAGKNFDGTTRAAPSCGGLDHLEIQGSASGVTCSPTTLTVKACGDSACSTVYTGGVSGTLTATGTPTVNWDGSSGGAAGAGFVIASGTSTVTKNVQVTTVGSVVFGVAATPSPAPANGATCNFSACTHTAADSGFLFNRAASAPNAQVEIAAHASETTQSFKLSAVKAAANNPLTCTPAFQSTTVPVTFKCSYLNPSSSDGTLPIRVTGNTTGATVTALNSGNNASAACDGTGASINVLFDANGESSTAQQAQNLRMIYADVGQVRLSATAPASGTGSGLTMTGSSSFVVAPASFAFSAYPLAPTLIKAGNSFSATVTARNSAGNATPAFGKESPAEGVTLSFTKYQPTGGAASDGSFTGTVGSFSGGAATGTDLQWSEVGSGDLTATLTSGNYLGSALSASGNTGTTGAVGARFIPDHFDTVVTQGCAAGGFTYSGQALSVQVTARNLGGTTTQNYDGAGVMTPSFSKQVTLSDANAVSGGSLAPTTVAATAFTAGVATANPAFTFTRGTPDKAPGTIKLRAADTDSVSSASGSEGTSVVRIGRLALSNVFGTGALQLPVQAQYWSGSSWILNSGDSCTAIPATSIALSNYRDSKGASTASWTTSASGPGTLVNGQGTITLSAPTGSGTGSVDIAINLGTGTQDTSCLATHPVMTAPATSLAWLRGRNGNCAASTTYTADPSAGASFGVFPAEKKKAVHVRELF